MRPLQSLCSLSWFGMRATGSHHPHQSHSQLIQLVVDLSTRYLELWIRQSLIWWSSTQKWTWYDSSTTCQTIICSVHDVIFLANIFYLSSLVIGNSQKTWLQLFVTTLSPSRKWASHKVHAYGHTFLSLILCSAVVASSQLEHVKQETSSHHESIGVQRLD